MNNLAFYQMRAGDYEAAADGFRAAHGQMERLHGAANLRTLTMLNNVGRVLLLGGRAGEAEAVFRRVRAGVEALSPDHPYASQPLQWLGRALDAQGRTATAIAALESALAMAGRLLPAEHPRASEARVALGSIHLREGRLAEAEAALRPVLAWRVKHLDSTDPEIAEAALLLARCRAEQGARAEADSLYADGIGRLEGNRYRVRETAAARQELADRRARWR
jgi:tetratricopeptide (TPR) repeat protein